MTPKTDADVCNALADKYRDEDFERNPNGYTVATYCNSETTSTAFEAGWSAALRHSPVVKELVEACRYIYMAYSMATPADHVKFAHNMTSAAEKARLVIDEYEKAVGE